MKRISNAKVAGVFDRYPRKMKQKLMKLRQLIFDVAAKTKGVGELEETLKWGEPAYLTSQTKSGSLIRIDVKKSDPSKYAMYFHCQTRLVNSFELYSRMHLVTKKIAQLFSMKMTVCL